MFTIVVLEENIKENIIKIIDKTDINHIKNAFRLKVNDKLRIVDGNFEYMCKIIDMNNKEILCDIIKKEKDKYYTGINIEIALGLLKNDKMDLAIQKLTEIGINKLIPLITNRTIVKIKEKKEKWDKVSKESIKQCQRVKFMEITDPIRLKDLNLDKYDQVIVPYEKNNGVKITDILDKKIKNLLYIIGSEGGFEEKEIEELLLKGAKAVSLGKRILRAETAAIVAGGIIINEFE